MKQFMQEGVRFALAQMPIEAGNPRKNADWMIAEIKRADARGVDVIIFPELAVSGYLIGDMFEDDSFVRDVWRQNERIILATKGLSVHAIFGTIVTDGAEKKGEDGRLRKINGGLVVHDGRVCTNRDGTPFFAKTNLPKYRMFDEVRHMYTALQLARESGMDVSTYLQPFHLYIRGKTLTIAPTVCEDMWDDDYLVKPIRIIAKKGADVVINVSMSPWGWQKNRVRNRTVKALVAEVKVPFIYVNGSGTQNNGKNMHEFDGTTTVYNEHGEVVFYLRPYYEGVEDVTLTLDMPKVEYTEPDDVTQLYDGVVYGIKGHFDLLPPRLRKVVVGLSGGIDSAVVAALMVKVLGAPNVVGINMPYGDYNSAETKDNARETARRLGIEYHVIPITDDVDAKAKQMNVTPGSGQFKTLQAIMRMITLQTYASMIGGVFSSNGNKPEIAFGWFTKNGDGLGSIAPLADLLKGEVYQLAHHLNTVQFDREVVPQAVIDVDPMDELGPQEGERKDPYDYGRVLPDGTLVRGYHDQMVHALLGFRKNPEWFLEQYLAGTLEEALLLPEGKLASLFASDKDFVEDIERCWKAFHSATWKRVQSVPSVLVSKRAFGWDFRESVVKEAYFTDRYHELKDELLAQ